MDFFPMSILRGDYQELVFEKGEGNNRDARKGGVPWCGGDVEQDWSDACGKWSHWKVRLEVLDRDDRG